MTDLLLCEIALNPNEYVEVDELVCVRYLKLAGKKVEYQQSLTSDLTVRWEFTEKAGDYMQALAYMWSLETDILHPQIYPLRAADYLTRKIKVSGILDEVVSAKNLKLKNRERRDTCL
jgi:hypothetical protein